MLYDEHGLPSSCLTVCEAGRVWQNREEGRSRNLGLMNRCLSVARRYRLRWPRRREPTEEH